MDIDWTDRPGRDDRDEEKCRRNLLAPRRLPVRRYGRMPRAAYRGAVEKSSSAVYQAYSRVARVEGESRVPSMRWRSAS